MSAYKRLLTQLRLIVWKSTRIGRRQWILIIIEILIPILLFTLFAYGRSRIEGIKKVEIKHAVYANKSDMDYIFSNSPIKKLWFTPLTNFTEEIIKRTESKLKLNPADIQNFESDEELLSNYANYRSANQIIAAIYFRVQNNTYLDYDISLHQRYVTWETRRLFASLDITADSEGASSQYYYSGFVALQLAVDTSFIEMHLDGSSIDNQVTFSIQEFPYPPQIVDSNLNNLFINYLPLITIFSFIFLCLITIEQVGKEKTSGLKELMKIYNMKSWMVWLGWLCFILIVPVLSLIFIVMWLKLPIWDIYLPVEFSNRFILYIFLLLYCLATVTFCFLFTTIFKDPSNLMHVGILFWIFSYFVPKSIVDSYKITHFWKILFGVFPNMALQYGYSAMSPFEIRGIGVQWHNMFDSGNNDANDITMGGAIIILLFDSIVFMLLTLYIDQVGDGFCQVVKSSCRSLYFCSCIKRGQEIEEESEEMNIINQETNAYIKISNLTKTFRSNVVLNKINMDIIKNQITIVLGKNGAGKSTLMNILAGTIDKTSGEIIYVNNDKDEKVNDKFREDLSYCPQHNTLFPYLTVIEHLQFCSKLNNNLGAEGENKIKKLLEEFRIWHKRNQLTENLSDRTKRKLCLAMALIKEPEFLILDEPTAGLDVESKQEIWEILKFKIDKPCTMIISTHSLEETDFLGDWIFVMNNGEGTDFRSRLEFANEYRTYNLSVMIDSDNKQDEENIKTFIINEISGSYLLHKKGKTFVFSLPLNENAYGNLFDKLEVKQNEFKITSMDFRPNTLNDAFINVINHQDYEENDQGKFNNSITYEFNRLNEMKRASKKQSNLKHIIVALLLKRWYYFKSKCNYYFIGMFVSILSLVFCVWFSNGTVNFYNYDKTRLNLNLDIYSKNEYGKIEALYGNYENSSFYSTKLEENCHNLLLSYNINAERVGNVSKEILNRGKRNIAYFKTHLLMGTEFDFNENYSEILINSMYSRYAIHALPISINVATNTVVRSLFNKNFSINVVSKPFKTGYTDFSPSELPEIDIIILLSTIIPLGVLFLMSTFIIFPNIEIATNFIRIQIMAGVKLIYYWLSNIICDWLVCLLKLVLLVSVIFCTNELYDSKAFNREEFRVFSVIFLTHTITALPYTYFFSFKRHVPGGITLFIMCGIFFGIVPTIIVRAMELSDEDSYKAMITTLKLIFIPLFPPFTLIYSFVKFSQKYVENRNWDYMHPNKKEKICELYQNPCCSVDSLQCHEYRNYFYDEKLGIVKEINLMWISFFIYFAVLLLQPKISKFICAFFNKPHSKKNKGVIERCNKFLLQIFQENISSSLGLVGKNNSGKSTVFRMLLKDTNYGEDMLHCDGSEESFTVNSRNVLSSKHLTDIGYCPQKDSLNTALTGKQLLQIIAQIKGYSSEDSKQITKYIIKLFDLHSYRNRKICNLSRGNRRKLSCALAFLGFPRIILLDQPLNGVDLQFIYKIEKIWLMYKEKYKTSFLLSTQDVQDCKDLCDKFIILENGETYIEKQLSDLNTEFSQNYKVRIYLNCNNKDDEKERILDEFMENNLNAKKEKSYTRLLIYNLPDHLTMRNIYMKMQEMKSTLDIEYYTITGSALERVRTELQFQTMQFQIN